MAVVTHGKAETSGEALARLRSVAEERRVELLLAGAHAGIVGAARSVRSFA